MEWACGRLRVCRQPLVRNIYLFLPSFLLLSSFLDIYNTASPICPPPQPNTYTNKTNNRSMQFSSSQFMVMPFPTLLSPEIFEIIRLLSYTLRHSTRSSANSIGLTFTLCQGLAHFRPLSSTSTLVRVSITSCLYYWDSLLTWRFPIIVDSRSRWCLTSMQK